MGYFVGVVIDGVCMVFIMSKKGSLHPSSFKRVRFRIASLGWSIYGVIHNRQIIQEAELNDISVAHTRS